MDSRRTVLKKMLAGLAATLVPAVPAVALSSPDFGSHHPGMAPNPADSDRVPASPAVEPLTDSVVGDVAPAVSEGPAPWWVFEPLSAGSTLGLGWSLEDVGRVIRGASVITLRHDDGPSARVHLCRNAGRPVGLAHTSLFDFVLMNGGDGDKRSEEALGRVILGLANAVRDKELAAVPVLEAHDERLAVYGPEVLA